MNRIMKDFATNKLIILLIFNEIDFPISMAQTIDIILQNNLINYFDIQDYIKELEDSFLIEKVKNKDLFSITKTGRQAITALINNIPGDITELIKNYIIKNKEAIKLETQVFANYIKKSDTEYIVILKVVENEIVLIELKLNVVSASQAKQICDKWKQVYSQIYDEIVNILIK